MRLGPTRRLSFCVAAALVLVVGCSEKPGDPAAPPVETEAQVAASPPPGGMPPITPVSGTGTLAPTHTDQFTFWVFGDNRDGAAVFSKIMLAAAQQKPAFALSLGDIIEGEPLAPVPRDAIEKALDNPPPGSPLGYLQLVRQGGLPVYNAPGNHEMITKIPFPDDQGYPAECPDRTMQEIYENKVAPLYGAFTFGNSRFIVLNTDDLPVTCPPDECPICIPCTSGGAPGSSPLYECSFVGDTQLQHLKDDLANNTDRQHIFIAMHYPMKPAKPADQLLAYSLDRLNTILDDHQRQYGNIKFVLASHEHRFYNPQDPDNDTTIDLSGAEYPYYLVTGGAGAPISHPGTTGHFYHYLVFDVDGDDISVTIERVSS